MGNKAVLKVLDRIEEYIIGILFSATLILLLISVAGRYLFSYAPPWAEQVATICFVWITYAGASLAAKNLKHLRVTAILLILPKRGGEVMMLIGEVITSITVFIMSAFVLRIAMIAIERQQVFAVMMNVPVWIIYIPGFLGLAGMGIRTIQYSIVPAVRKFASRETTLKK